MTDDLYQTLGVPRTATSDEIKSAYRSLAKKYHPDLNPGDAHAEDMFKRVTAAYDVLGDETKRAQYDRFGSADGGAQNTYNTQGQYWSWTQDGQFDEDVFWQWFRSQAEHQSQGGGRGGYRTSQNESKGTRREELRSQLYSKLFQTLFSGMIFLFAGWYFPFLSFICFFIMINGIVGAVRLLGRLLHE